MDGSSVYKQSGGVEWRTDVMFQRDGWIVYETENGQRKVSAVQRGSLVGGIVNRYAYLDPAPPSEPKLKWHRWSESKPDRDECWTYINVDGYICEMTSDDDDDAIDAVWWCYDPCSSKYGE